MKIRSSAPEMLQTARNHNSRLLPTFIRSGLPSYDAVYFNVSKEHAASTFKAVVYLKMAAVFYSGVCNHVPDYTVSLSLNCCCNFELSPIIMYSASTFQTRHRFPTSQGTDQSVQRLRYRLEDSQQRNDVLLTDLMPPRDSKHPAAVCRPSKQHLLQLLPAFRPPSSFPTEANHTQYRVPNRSGYCYYLITLSSLQLLNDVIVSATPFNRYSSIESPTSHSESRCHT
jgi:hypothetical protein